jgi:hypothetical protein
VLGSTHPIVLEGEGLTDQTLQGKSDRRKYAVIHHRFAICDQLGEGHKQTLLQDSLLAVARE